MSWRDAVQALGGCVVLGLLAGIFYLPAYGVPTLLSVSIAYGVHAWRFHSFEDTVRLDLGALFAFSNKTESQRISWWNPFVKARGRYELRGRFENGVSVCLKVAYEEPWRAPARSWAVARLFMSDSVPPGGNEASTSETEADNTAPRIDDAQLDTLPIEERTKVRMARLHENVVRLRDKASAERRGRAVTSLLQASTVQVLLVPDYVQITHTGNPRTVDVFEILELLSSASPSPDPTAGDGYRGAPALAVRDQAVDIAAADEVWNAFPKWPRSGEGV